MSSVSAGNVREDAVLQALRAVEDPDLHRDIVSLGFVKNLRICGGSVALDIELTTPACPVKEKLKDDAARAIRAIPGVSEVAVNMTAQVRKSMPILEGGLRAVRNAVAIASGKGGVGKSTVTANLALALARTGASVGLMDADVYGPSIATMLGGGGRPEQNARGQIIPLDRYGIRYMSMGLLAGRDTPVIWRGPMATKLVQQFLGGVEWGELDYLLVDLPPGTGDVQLTLTQSAPLTGAVIVTTPQDVAVGVTLRGLRMFEQVQVPILGIVENMSFFACPHCHGRTDVFRHGGGARAAAELGYPFLGEVPLDPALALAGDAGRPLVLEDDPSSDAGKAFRAIAERLAAQVSIVQAKTASVRFRPEEVRNEDAKLVIRWSDQQVSRYDYRALRLECPCAECVDEWTRERRLDPAHVPADVHPLEVRPVGRYALQIVWSDRHASGIYSFDKLRALDPSIDAPVATAPQT
jgi:ATP-binding protein involved in chromosome partitioning